MNNFKCFYHRLATFVILMTLIAASRSFAQETGDPIVIGKAITIHSKVLNEDREIQIYVPDGYATSQNKYPVLYLLDGPAHFHYTTGIVEFLAQQGRAPQLIVVAIANTDRDRDLTPTHSIAISPGENDETLATSGGADNFLKFIKDELFAYMGQNYRTEPYRILIGHSLGGLFAIHTLLTQSDTFSAYIAISPSLWWDNKIMLKNAETYFAKQPVFNNFLFMTLGNEGGRQQASIERFLAILGYYAPQGLSWKFQHMDKETHGSVTLQSTYQGLEALYSDWSLSRDNLKVIVEMGGVAAVIDSVDGHYRMLSQKYGYEIKTPERVYNLLGYELISLKKYDEAVSILKRNVSIYPDSPNVYDSLGDAYDAGGQLELAQKSYEQAVKMAEPNSHPYLDAFKKNLERIRKKISAK